jgi:Uma2 family endonuclease
MFDGQLAGAYTFVMSNSLPATAVTGSEQVAEVVFPVGPLTAEQFAELRDLGYPAELVRGQIKLMNRPYPEHGQICVTVAVLIADFVRKHKLGRVVGNDSGVVTERQPDSVRGPDVAYYSYDRVPPGRLKRRGYLDVTPELAVEVKSAFDRWKDIDEKIDEYFKAGVLLALVIDPDTDSAQVRFPDKPTVTYQRDDELELAEVLPGFRVTVREFFE